MAELPDEIIEMMKKRWREISRSSDHEQSDPKRGKYTPHHRCKHCTCYSCCRHMWICQHERARKGPGRLKELREDGKS